MFVSLVDHEDELLRTHENTKTSLSTLFEHLVRNVPVHVTAPRFEPKYRTSEVAMLPSEPAAAKHVDNYPSEYKLLRSARGCSLSTSHTHETATFQRLRSLHAH